MENVNIDELITEVADALRSDLEVQRKARLAKGAQEDAPAEESSGSSGPAAPEASGPPAEASPEGSAPPPEAEAPVSPEQSAPEGSPGHESGEIEPAHSLEELTNEYMKLDPEAKKMHYLAAKAALAADMGGGAPAPEASAPPAPAPAGPGPMQMSERGKQLPHNKGNGGPVKLGKSEDVAKAERRADELQKQIDAQTDAVGKLAKAVTMLTTPVRRSVKGVSDLPFIARSGAEGSGKLDAKGLNKAEAKEILKRKVREGKLSKADKDLVMKFDVGMVGLDKIEHLLAPAKQ